MLVNNFVYKHLVLRKNKLEAINYKLTFEKETNQNLMSIFNNNKNEIAEIKKAIKKFETE